MLFRIQYIEEKKEISPSGFLENFLMNGSVKNILDEIRIKENKKIIVTVLDWSLQCPGFADYDILPLNNQKERKTTYFVIPEESFFRTYYENERRNYLKEYIDQYINEF